MAMLSESSWKALRPPDSFERKSDMFEQSASHWLGLPELQQDMGKLRYCWQGMSTSAP
jgi:hypothetical protein